MQFTSNIELKQNFEFGKKVCDFSFHNFSSLHESEIIKHFGLGMYQHKRNPINNKSYSIIIFHSCNPNSLITIFRWITKKEMFFGKLVGFRYVMKSDRISLDDLKISLIRPSIIINNPNSRRHLKFELRNLIKQLLPKNSAYLVNKAQKNTLSNFTSQYGQKIIIRTKNSSFQFDSSQFWRYVNVDVEKINHTFVSSLRTFFSAKKEYKSLNYFFEETD